MKVMLPTSILESNVDMVTTFADATTEMIKVTKHKLPGQIKNANHGQFMEEET